MSDVEWRDEAVRAFRTGRHIALTTRSATAAPTEAADQVVTDRRIRWRFGKHIYRVRLHPCLDDVRNAAVVLAAARMISPGIAPVRTPDMGISAAAETLDLAIRRALLMARAGGLRPRRLLLVLDDLRSAEQLIPYLDHARCTILVTTGVAATDRPAGFTQVRVPDAAGGVPVPACECRDAPAPASRAAITDRWPPSTGDPDSDERRTHPVTALAIAPDGSWLVTGGPRLGTAYLWDTRTGTLRGRLHGHLGRIWSVAVAPDGTWLATAAHDRTIRVRDTGADASRRVLHGPTDPVTAFWAVAIVPDGSWLIGADNSRGIWVWDTATWQVLATPNGRHSGVAPIAVAPDGTWVAIGDSDGNLTRRDTATWQVISQVAAHRDHVWAIAVAPDSSWYATAGRDTAIRVWETTAAHPVATLLGHTDGVAALALSPDGRLLASGGYDGTVRIWSPADSRLLAARPMPGHVHALSWLPDGTALAAGTEDGLFLLSIDSN